MEQWKKLRFNENYLISNKGRIISPNGRELITSDSRGYSVVQQILLLDGRRRAFRASRLVWEHFGQFNVDWSKYDISHLNGDYSDCSIDNIRVFPRKSYIKKISKSYKDLIRHKLTFNGVKSCCICGEICIIEEFYFHKTYNRYMDMCKPCQNKRISKAIKKKYDECGKYRLKVNVKARIVSAIKRGGYKKKSKTREVLGCDWDFLKSYLESRFQKGMTWDNYGEWHVDHIIPLAMATTEKQVYKLSHYTHLQPLWSEENRAKSDNLPKDQIEKAKELGLEIDYSKII